MQEIQLRGMLTDCIRKESEKLLGYEIGVIELRLMAYIVYVVMNERRIDQSKVNAEEGAILQKWREAGHMEGGASGVTISKKFWTILTKLMWLGYVNIEGTE